MALGQSANHTPSLGQYWFIGMLPTLVLLIVCSTITDQYRTAMQNELEYRAENNILIED